MSLATLLSLAARFGSRNAKPAVPQKQFAVLQVGTVPVLIRSSYWPERDEA